MPAAGLLDIKRRIKSVQNTKKITKAMGLVSTSKLRKAKENLAINNNYFKQLEDMRADVFELSDDGVNDVFVTGNDNQKKLFVVFTSNSGLCGSFNGNGFMYLNEEYSKEKENMEVLVIGQRGVSYAHKYGFKIFNTMTDIKDSMTIKEARDLAVKIMSSFLDGTFGEVYLVYTQYISSFKQEVLADQILPLTIKEDEEQKESETNIFNTDVDLTQLVTSFLYRYIEGKLINVSFNSKTSEENARMQAMDGASKNAEDILDKLNAEYNRIRQSAITQEISEIVGGAAAQK